MMANRKVRSIPEGAEIVTISEIFEDVQGWELFLTDSLSLFGESFSTHWVPAENFAGNFGGGRSSIAPCPSGMAVIARRVKKEG